MHVHYSHTPVADPENLVGGGAFSNNREQSARENFGHAPLTRNHALIITANEINSMEIGVLSLQAGF